MQGFDVRKFMEERSPAWEELETMLARVEQDGIDKLGLEGARRFGRLYRGVSSDLLRARTEMVDAKVIDYLNDLVARTYAHVYATSTKPGRRALRFLLVGYPQLVRAEWRAIALSTLLMSVGAAAGALAVAFDPSSLGVVIMDQHQEWTPEERVRQEEEGGGNQSGDVAVAFSSLLFTHNIGVTFLVFALGITFGIGTAYVLFANGVIVGALAMQYHLAGQALFFWAWILPHGIPELTAIAIAGGAGLVIARGLVMPGQRLRKDALYDESKRAIRLILGTMPVLVLAGLIEGTISQMHEPVVPYVAKLAFAGLIGIAVYAYLLFAGRDAPVEDDADRDTD